MLTKEELERIEKEEINKLLKGLKERGGDGVKEATLVDGTKIKLAITREWLLDDYTYEFVYVTEDKERITTGFYSGGLTGGGAHFSGWFNREFVQWV